MNKQVRNFLAITESLETISAEYGKQILPFLASPETFVRLYPLIYGIM